MQDKQEIELIDYLNVIWKRKGLIIGGTLLSATVALVVSLSMPKTYEVSRTLRVGRLAGSKVIEEREAVIGRLKDHRVLKMVIEKIHVGMTAKEMDNLIFIDTKTNPDVRYTVQAYDPQIGTQIADLLVEYITKVHRPIFERSMQIIKEYEGGLAAEIHSIETENRNLKKIFESVIEHSNIDSMTVVLLQTSIGQRERDLADLRKELKEVRLSRIGYENTTLIAADEHPQDPIKPRIKLNVVLAGTLGLMGFTFLAFFLEYIEKAKGKR